MFGVELLIIDSLRLDVESVVEMNLSGVYGMGVIDTVLVTAGPRLGPVPTATAS